MSNSTLDLGELFSQPVSNTPVLLFGGAYSNLQALQAIRKQAEALGIPADRCICTGDIVAYCARAADTVAKIRDWGVHCLMGNCEESFATDAEDCGCGFEEGTSCDLLSAQWFQHANQQLGQNDRQWFASLPRKIIFSANGKSCEVVHGSVSSINQFLFSSTDNAIFQEQLTMTEADIIIGGHCGIPFNKTFDINGKKRAWHNAGAIGMPANDGTQQTWFSLMQATNNGLEISHQALKYDAESAYADMQSADMDNGYAKALNSGLWPSMDVLPQQEKDNQGIALAPSTIII